MGPVWFVHSKSIGVVEGRWPRDIVFAGEKVGQVEEWARCVRRGLSRCC